MDYSGVSGISNYMTLLLKSQFPYSNLLDADGFLVFLKKRGIDLTKEELEYYDEKGIIRPALRLYRTLVREGSPTYDPIFSDIFSMKLYYEDGLIAFPHDGDFCPWSNYIDDNHQEKISSYYHPFQFVAVRQLIKDHGFRLNAKYLETVEDIHERFQGMKNSSAEDIRISRKANIETWIPRVGLLMLLEEAYSPYVDGPRSSIHDPAFVQKWYDWRLRRFSPQDILTKSRMTVNAIKQFYEVLSTEAHWMDPLGNWFVLLQLITNSKKRELKKEALLAQQYYQLAQMVSWFIYDLTKERMPDPDDITDGNRGKWKPKKYGKPFDYQKIRTRNMIVSDYFYLKPTRLTLICEGKTEHTVIMKILRALNYDPKRGGLVVYNAEGGSNIRQKNLDGLIHVSKANSMDVYIIIDNDKGSESIIQNNLSKKNIRRGMYYIWNRDFEHDNFKANDVITRVNFLLHKRGYSSINDTEAGHRMAADEKCGLMRSIRDEAVDKNSLIWNREHIKFDDIVGKKALAEYLIKKRVREIMKEREGEGWKPKLKIERILRKLFYKISLYPSYFKYKV